MLKRKIKWIVLTGVASLATLPVISCSTNAVKNEQSYNIGTNTFLNKGDLLDHIQKRTTKKTKESSNSASQWRMDGVDRIFDSPKDIDVYVQKHNIHNKVASIALDNSSFQDLEKDYFSSIPSNSVIPLETNGRGEVTNSGKGMAIAYKGNNDQIYFVKANETDEQIDLIKKAAKNSWIQFHSVYKFNGIYFRNIEDLDYYLRHSIYDKAIDGNSGFEDTINKQVNLPVGTTGGKVDYDSFILLKLADGSIDKAALKATLEEKIKARSEKVLAINGGETIINRNDIENNDSNAAKLANHINSWNIGSQDQSSYYVVDTVKGSRGSLHGNYFLNSPNDIGGVSSINGQTLGIMNTLSGNGGASWAKYSGTPSVSDLQDQSNADADLMGSTISESIANIVNAGPETGDDDGREFGMYDVLHFEGKENGFTTFLNNISSDSRLQYKALGDGLKNISNTLKSGKKYNAFYSLPVLRGWVISRLLENRVSQENLEKVNDYFINATQDIQEQVNKDLGMFLIDNNKLDLNEIYEFKNHSSTLYVDPRTGLNKIPKNVKNELRVSQGLKSYVSNYLTYVPIHNMIDDLQKIQDQINVPAQYNNGMSYNQKQVDSIGFGQVGDRKALAFRELLFENGSGEFLSKLSSNFNDFIKWYMNQPSVKEENKIIASFNDVLNNYKGGYTERKSTLENFYNDFLKQTNIKNGSIIGSASYSTKCLNFMDSNELYQTIENAFSNTTSLLDHAGKILGNLEKAKKVLVKLEKILSFCEYLEVAFVAIDIIIDIIDFFTPKTTQTFYSYRSPDDQSYYWDGGEHVTQFMGLRSEDTHGISELKLLPPIRITVPHIAKASERSGSASNFYFDGKFYNGESSVYVQLADNVLSKLNQDDNKNITTQADYDLYIKSLKNYIKSVFDDEVILVNEFNGEYWADNEKTSDELSNLNDIIDYKTNYIVAEDKGGAPPLYLKDIYSTPNGVVDDKNIAVDTYVKNITGVIKPTYIFQRPKTSKGVLTQLPFSLPFPYYSLTSNSVNDKGDANNDLAGLQIEYNSNIDPTTTTNKDTNIESSTNDIIKDNLEKIGQDFSVPQREVSYREVLTTNNYSELKGNIFIRNIYVSKSPMGQTKYFFNLSAAILWIRIEYNVRLSIINLKSDEYVYNSEIDSKEHAFSSLTSEINWIMKNEVSVAKGAQ